VLRYTTTATQAASSTTTLINAAGSLHSNCTAAEAQELALDTGAVKDDHSRGDAVPACKRWDKPLPLASMYVFK
jgi:hypothetical protein